MGASNLVPDTIQFHDIAGLVAGAHKGEGLGNQFLANIRETDALLHVVRAHHDDNVIHPEGRVDPLADLETIETELIYADLEQAERRHGRVVREARGGDRAAIAEEAWLRAVIEALQSGQPVRTVPVPDDAPDAMRNLGPLTGKPVLIVANVDVAMLSRQGQRHRPRGAGWRSPQLQLQLDHQRAGPRRRNRPGRRCCAPTSSSSSLDLQAQRQPHRRGHGHYVCVHHHIQSGRWRSLGGTGSVERRRVVGWEGDAAALDADDGDDVITKFS